MTRIESDSDYDEFVAMVASRGNIVSESHRFVAERAIVDTENVGDVKTLRYALEPLARDPVEQTRIWPKDVLEHSEQSWEPDDPDDLRELAVEVLARDIAVEMEAQYRG